MHVVVFASQKGGSGKTTLAGHIAVMADQAGYGPVAMLDTDPQGSLAQWWNARRADTPLFVRSALTELPETLAALEERGIAMVVIDTPPAITIAIRSVVENADLVVVPVRPSPHDLRAAGATVDLVEGLDRPFVFAVNAASARARITADAAVALSQHGTVAPVTIHNRTEFAVSMSDGRTVMEINPEGRSAQEMHALWAYIAERLDRNARLAGRLASRLGGRALSDFVRETYDPGPRAAALAAREGIPRATIEPRWGAPTLEPTPASANNGRVPPMRVVETDPLDDGVDEDGSNGDGADGDGVDHGGETDDILVKDRRPVRAAATMRVAPDRSQRGSTTASIGAQATPSPLSQPVIPQPLASAAGRGTRPTPAQGRSTRAQRHPFGRRGMAEV